jgi:hypothetical protein
MIWRASIIDTGINNQNASSHIKNNSFASSAPLRDYLLCIQLSAEFAQYIRR